MSCKLIRQETANERSGWLRLVRDHVVAADLWPVLNPFKRVVGVAGAVIQEKLLHARRLVLVLHVRLAAEEADRAQLVPNDECLPVAAELAVERVVTHVPVDRVNTVLAETLNYLLLLYVPQDERAAVAASHEQLLEDGVRGQHPRVLLELVAAGPRQIVIKRLVDRVPDLDPTHFLLEFFCLCGHGSLISRIFDLARDAGDGEAAPYRPLDGVALALRELDGGLLARLAEADLAADRLLNGHILEVLRAVLVKVRDRVRLDAAIPLVNRHNQPAVILHAKRLQHLLLQALGRGYVQPPNFH